MTPCGYCGQLLAGVAVMFAGRPPSCGRASCLNEAMHGAPPVKKP